VTRSIDTDPAKPYAENTTGKKFAPKAARRRPGAAPAAPTPSAPETPAPAADPQTSQAEPEASNAPAAEPPTTAQPPAPAATQEPVVDSAPTPQPVSTASTPSVATAVSSAPRPTPTPATPLSPPVHTNTESQTRVQQEVSYVGQATADRGLTTQYLEDGVEAGRSPKRRRIEPPARPSGSLSPDVVADGGDAASSSRPIYQEKAASSEPQPDTEETVAEGAPTPATEGTEQLVEGGAVQPAGDSQALPQPRKRRKLPWVAVNHRPDDEEEGVAAPPTRKPRQPPKPRGKKKVTADADADHLEEEGDEEEAQPTRKRPSVKARGRKKATEPTTQDGEEAPTALKRIRKPRKARSQAIVEETEDEVGRIADEIVAAAVRRKPKKRKREATPDGNEVEGVEGEEGTREKKKKRGRQPREATPSDAEDQTIDPDVTYMDSLAARDVRWGRKSNLEMEMREIDWEAVKLRRREEDSRTIVSKAEQEAADRALAEQGAELAAQAGTGTQLRWNEATNSMEIVPESGTIDREGDADREIAAMVVHEDRDITNRLTTRSFMKNNKRFPNDFLLPGQGRRWNTDLTTLFYDGLRSFGTDFQMISQMFPGFTRRSIKTKFTREERDNPEGVKEALRCRSELNSGGWNMFLKESSKTEASFADVAKKDSEERRRQRELAGVDAQGNPIDEAANKDNGNGKKTRKKKGQHVTFEQEPGVEIMVDDDPNWGVE
jgi:transcription factor TFIIIB component B''